MDIQTYKELGFDSNLNRGSSLLLGDSGLPSTPIPNTLNGGTYNGVEDLVSGELDLGQLPSGEMSEKLTLTRNAHIKGGATDYNEGEGWWLGYRNDEEDFAFFVGDADGNKMTYNPDDGLVIVGSITATTGTIGGWTISSNALTSGNVIINSANEQILMGLATAPLTGTGIFLGLDGADYEFRAGDPDNDLIHWDGSALSISGALTAGELHIPDEDATANSFHVNTAGDSWWGATKTNFDSDNDNATAYVLKTGVAKFQSVTAESTTTIENIKIVGRITAGQDLTAGFDLTQGEGVAVESDAQMWPVRATAFDAQEDTDTNTAGAGKGSFGAGGRTPFVKISDTVLLRFFKDTGGGVDWERLVYDIKAKTFTSASTGTITTTTTINNTIDRLSDTTAIFVGTDGITDMYAEVLSGLDSGVTDNAELQVDTDASSPIVLAKSSTVALLIYGESSTEDLKFRQLNISGTTVTNDASGEQALHTAIGGGSLSPYDIQRFGTTDFYAATFEDADGTQKIIIFDWDGTTMDAGTAADVSMAADTQPVLVPLDDTRMAVVAHDEAVIITRTGTTPAVGTSITWTSAGGAFSSAAKLGADSFLTFTDNGAGAGEIKIIRVDDDGSTLTNFATFGTTYTTTNDNRANGVIKVSPELFCICHDTDASTSQFTFISLTTTISQFAGVAAEAITDGNTGIVVLNGYTDDLTGNTAGDILYPDLDGAFTTTDYGAVKAILALSATTGKVF